MAGGEDDQRRVGLRLRAQLVVARWRVLDADRKLALIDDPKALDVTKLKRKSLSLHWEFMYTRSLFETTDMQEQHVLLNKVAELRKVGIFPRFAVMKDWHERQAIPIENFVISDGLHMSDWGYACFAQLLGDDIIDERVPLLEAMIEQGTEIPYQEAASSGAATIQFKKAVLSLKVTPQITPDNRIILDLDVKDDSVGQVAYSNLIGRAFVVMWPFADWHWL